MTAACGRRTGPQPCRGATLCSVSCCRGSMPRQPAECARIARRASKAAHRTPAPRSGSPAPGSAPHLCRRVLARGAARAEGDRQRGETEGPLQRPFSSQGIKRMLLGFALLGLLGGSHAPTPLLSHAPLDRPSSREAAASQAEWGDHSWGVPQERQEESSRPWPALVRRLSRRHPGCADPPR